MGDNQVIQSREVTLMQPISATSYNPRAGAKTAPSGKADRKPVRRRRRQQNGSSRLTLNRQLAKAVSRYA